MSDYFGKTFNIIGNDFEELRMTLHNKEYDPSIALRIAKLLTDDKYQFSVSIDDNDIVYFRIKHASSDRLYIRHKVKRNTISISMVLDYDPNMIEQKRNNLLYACNYNDINTSYVKTTLLSDCIHFYYRMPPGTEECIEKVLREVLYDLMVNCDIEMLDSVVKSNIDIEKYCKNKDEEFHEMIKVSIENYKSREIKVD